MIEFIVGLPGGGKGIMAMCRVVAELRETERPIVTNLAVRLQPWVTRKGVAQMGLLAYLRREYGKTFNAENRIVLLTDEQAAEFYLWRAVRDGVGFALRQAEARRRVSGGRECVLEFDTSLLGAGPCYYIIDEAWKFFGSRNWQTTGEGVLFYGSQHRKTGDDVEIVTQSTKQIDAALVRLGQQFLLCVNRGKRRMFGWRQPDGIKYLLFADPPGGQTQTPMLSGTEQVDVKGVCQTYDTTAGVGMVGGGVGDMGAKKKGWPFWSLVVGVFGLGFVVLVVLRLALGSHFMNLFIPSVGGASSHAGSTNAPGLLSSLVPSVEVPVASGVVAPVTATNHVYPEWLELPVRYANCVYLVEVRWRGVLSDLRGEVVLSNNQVFPLRSCSVLTDRYVEIRGERFYLESCYPSVPINENTIPHRELRGVSTNSEKSIGFGI